MTAAAANEQEGPCSWGQDGANGSDELIQHVRLQASRPA
jgi:hypothetical protein